MSITKLEVAENHAEPMKALEKTQPVEVAAVAEAEKEVLAVSKVDLETAVRKLNELVSAATTIMFSLDEDSGKYIVRVVDVETQKVLRQIPNEEALAMSRNMDRLQGLILRQQA